MILPGSKEIYNMKVVGIILIIAGILMFIFGKVSFTSEKKLVDVGPLEINKKENKTLAWPSYAAGLAVVAGVVVLVAAGKKQA
jgi:uncharacterized membrane protein YidH (DUF202 family)